MVLDEPSFPSCEAGGLDKPAWIKGFGLDALSGAMGPVLACLSLPRPGALIHMGTVGKGGHRTCLWVGQDGEHGGQSRERGSGAPAG